MLLTVTANPSIDRVYHLDALKIGQVHRVNSLQLVAAGKGLNVTRAASMLGVQVLATGMLAGRNGETLAELVQRDGYPVDWYWLSSGESRMCIMLNQQAGDTTVINERGPKISAADWTGFAAHVERLARSAQAVVFSGSMPPGVPFPAPAKLARTLATTGRAVYFDVSHQHLPPLLNQPQGVCIKINRDELAAGMGISLEGDSLGPVIEAGQTLLQRGAALVVLTLGGRGALAISPRGVWQARPPTVETVSTVGSGDTMTAGLIAAQLNGLPVPQALAHGVAAGTANALNDVPGQFHLPAFESLLRQVQITQL